MNFEDWALDELELRLREQPDMDEWNLITAEIVRRMEFI